MKYLYRFLTSGKESPLICRKCGHDHFTENYTTMPELAKTVDEIRSFKVYEYTCDSCNYLATVTDSPLNSRN